MTPSVLNALGLVAASMALEAEPRNPPRRWGPPAPPSLTRTERARRKARRKAAKESRRRNRP